MTGRIPFGLLLSLTVLASWPILAQDQGGPPPGYFGIQPAAFQMPQDSAGQYQMPPSYGYQRGPGPQIPGPAPRTIYEPLPDDLGFTDPDTPFGNFLTNAFRHSWFRGEYMLFNISGPGSTLLGEQTSGGVPNPSVSTSALGAPTTVASQFTGAGPTQSIAQGVLFSRTVNGVTGFAQSPTTDNVSFVGLNGFRGTFGIPVPTGTIELGAFVLGTSKSTYDGTQFIQPTIAANPAASIGNPLGVNGLPATNFQPATFISQGVLVNGTLQPYSVTSGAFLDYDVSYQYRLTTTAWGSEVNYVGDTPDPNAFIQFKPIIGFRYLNFRDSLDQSGQYNQANPTNPAGTPTVVNRTINSGSNNNLYGPQIGFRTELTQYQFALGFEPKLMMALNTYSQTLNTSNVLSSTDPAQNLMQGATTFSPLVDLKVYSNIALSQYLSAFLSYNFIYVGDVNRSYNDVVYNKNSVTNQSAFSLQKTMSTVTLQGITVGFDFRY